MTEQTQQAEAPQQQGFSLNDLRALQQIVDMATQRGAFRAQELSSIGVIYDRLSSFLAASEAATAAAQGVTGATPPAPPAPPAA